MDWDKIYIALLKVTGSEVEALEALFYLMIMDF
jgi:hypothetical protein